MIINPYVHGGGGGGGSAPTLESIALTSTVPTVDAGDVLLLYRHALKLGSVGSTPSGWTFIHMAHYNGTNDARLAVDYLVCDGTEDGTVLSPGANGHLIARITGANSTPIMDSDTSNNVQNLTLPTLTATGACLAINAVGASHTTSDSLAIATANGFTQGYLDTYRVAASQQVASSGSVAGMATSASSAWGMAGSAVLIAAA